jgi:hypothetical protein
MYSDLNTREEHADYSVEYCSIYLTKSFHVVILDKKKKQEVLFNDFCCFVPKQQPNFDRVCELSSAELKIGFSQAASVSSRKGRNLYLLACDLVEVCSGAEKHSLYAKYRSVKLKPRGEEC